MNTTTEFCIFKLVKIPNFSLNWQVWLFGPNLPKKGVSRLKQKKWTVPLNSAYSNLFRYQISALIDNFDFLDQVYPKGVISVKKGKSEHHHWILHIRISLGTKLYSKLTIFIYLFFWPNLRKKAISCRKWKNRICPSVHGRYLLY